MKNYIKRSWDNVGDDDSILGGLLSVAGYVLAWAFLYYVFPYIVAFFLLVIRWIFLGGSTYFIEY